MVVNMWREVYRNGKGICFDSDRWVCGDGDYATLELYLDSNDINRIDHCNISCFSGVPGYQVTFDSVSEPHSKKLDLSLDKYMAINFEEKKNEGFSWEELDHVIKYYKWCADEICEIFCD